jgi:predicted amidohydrolase YtcJ
MKPRMPWLGLVLALASLSVSSRPGAPDLILVNGRIFTSNTTHPYIQALAIRGERIVAVRDSATVGALAGPQSRK